MISRLLLFEGPPGGGKSSISQFVTQQLDTADRPAHWIEEHTLNATFFAPVFACMTAAPAEASAVMLTAWRTLIDQLQETSEVWCLDGAFFHFTLKLLLAYDADCFAIIGRPQQLEFVRDAQGTIQGAIYPFVPEQRFFCEKIR